MSHNEAADVVDAANALSSPTPPPSSQPPILSAAALKVVAEARKKFNTCMENEVGDLWPHAEYINLLQIRSCSAVLTSDTLTHFSPASRLQTQPRDGHRIMRQPPHQDL